MSLGVIEFPACSPRLSSNGIRLSEFLKVDCGVPGIYKEVKSIMPWPICLLLCVKLWLNTESSQELICKKYQQCNDDSYLTCWVRWWGGRGCSSRSGPGSLSCWRGRAWCLSCSGADGLSYFRCWGRGGFSCSRAADLSCFGCWLSGISRTGRVPGHWLTGMIVAQETIVCGAYKFHDLA